MSESHSNKNLQVVEQAVDASLADARDSNARINHLIRVIRELAGKADILALNAAIEAARAGHAGKGFSIVADEVSRLSEKIQQAVGGLEVEFRAIEQDSKNRAA
jgi:methyl-accepting chemotaxis protein